MPDNEKENDVDCVGVFEFVYGYFNVEWGKETKLRILKDGVRKKMMNWELDDLKKMGKLWVIWVNFVYVICRKEFN